MMNQILVTTALVMMVDSSIVFVRPTTFTRSKQLIQAPLLVEIDATQVLPKWEEWSDWSQCSQDCNGMQGRTRECNGKVDCIDEGEERDCNPTGNTQCQSQLYYR